MFGIGLSLCIGAAIGISAMVYADNRCKRTAASLKARIQRLTEENQDLQNQLRQKFVQEAYSAGYEEGRKNPYDEAERFARAFGSRKIKYALNDNGQRENAM